MSEGTQNERVAVLETKVAAIEDTQKQLLAKQEEMLKALTRYKGMWGGISMLVAAIVTAVGLFISWFKG